jgi:hypothetical protein
MIILLVYEPKVSDKISPEKTNNILARFPLKRENIPFSSLTVDLKQSKYP